MLELGCENATVGKNGLRNFHDGMKVRVSVSGVLSDKFYASMGVKQGCVMAPVLFNIFMLCVTHIFDRDAEGEGSV